MQSITDHHGRIESLVIDENSPTRPRRDFLVCTFCTREYRHFLPFLAYSLGQYPGFPSLRVYAPKVDVAACREALQPLMGASRSSVVILPAEDFVTVTPTNQQLLRTLRWLIIDPAWEDFDSVLFTDVDMILTDRSLLDTRRTHMQALGKPYSNCVRPARDSAGRLKVQGVHFFCPRVYLPRMRPVVAEFSARLNAGELSEWNNESILAAMLERAYGLPQRTDAEPVSHHHGVHLNTFTPGLYSDSRLATFVNPSDLIPHFINLANTPGFQSLLACAPESVRRQISEALFYAHRLRSGRRTRLAVASTLIRNETLRRARRLYSRTIPPLRLLLDRHHPSTAVIDGHRFVPRLLSRNPLLIDVGYKYGEFALPFLERFGGQVQGYEPSLPSTRRARDLLAATPYTDAVSLHAQAVWIDARGIDFFEFADAPQSNSVQPRNRRDGTSIFVPTISLTEILEHAPRSIDLLKLDCEGAEWQIFRHTPISALRPVRQFTVELHMEFSAGSSTSNLIAYFRSAGYRVFVDYPWDDPTRPEIWGYRPWQQS